MRRRGALSVVSALLLTAPVAMAAEVKSYLVPVGDTYQVRTLLSVGDRVPLTGNAGAEYQLTGIPDGLGLSKKGDGTFTLYMNHEFRTDVSVESVVGAPLHRGALADKWLLDAEGNVLSAGPAFHSAYAENTYVGPAANVSNTTPAFGRFCSAVLVGRAYGFDRKIFLTNEEAETPVDPAAPPATFDARGGSTVAIYDGEAHALPALGHFSKENSLVQKGTEDRTVIVSLEDGPVTPDSQVYLYVGNKYTGPGATVLSRNGLDNGKLYVLASRDGLVDEAAFTQGTMPIEWREIPGARDLLDVDLETAVDGLGAFGFVRVEDGAFDTVHRNELFFAATGAPSTGNQLGRVYKLHLDPKHPTAPGRLTIVTNADQMHAAGAAVPLAPDNVGIDGDHLMIQEGGNGPSKVVLAEQGRDNSIWRFPLFHGRRHVRADAATATRVAEVDTPGRDGNVVPPGVWESSGIIPSPALFGPGSWLLTVQTFPPTVEPTTNTFRDGQLVKLTPAAP